MNRFLNKKNALLNNSIGTEVAGQVDLSLPWILLKDIFGLIGIYVCVLCSPDSPKTDNCFYN